MKKITNLILMTMVALAMMSCTVGDSDGGIEVVAVELVRADGLPSDHATTVTDLTIDLKYKITYNDGSESGWILETFDCDGKVSTYTKTVGGTNSNSLVVNFGEDYRLVGTWDDVVDFTITIGDNTWSTTDNKITWPTKSWDNDPYYFNNGKLYVDDGFGYREYTRL